MTLGALLRVQTTHSFFQERRLLVPPATTGLSPVRPVQQGNWASAQPTPPASCSGRRPACWLAHVLRAAPPAAPLQPRQHGTKRNQGNALDDGSGIVTVPPATRHPSTPFPPKATILSSS